MKKIILSVFLIIVIAVMGTIPVSAATLNCNYTLRSGNKGSRVSDLQKVLNEKMSCGLSVDGSFGPLTKKCVQAYQKSHDLDPDGIVGPLTCNSLNGNENKSSAVVEYEKSSTTVAIVTGSVVNVRKKATTSSEVLGTVKRGDVVNVYSRSGDWYSVRVNNTYGYIYSNLISMDCIVVDISDQVLYYYQDGYLYWSTNVVTGNKGNHDTPIGSYTLNKKNFRTSTYLQGYNDNGTRYKSYVDYWMPFVLNRGIGFHDATWRQSWEFNSTRFMGNGSHGCVNMQHDAAEKLYNESFNSINVVVRD